MSLTMLDELQARRLGLFNDLSQSDTEADRYSDLSKRHRDISADVRQKIADLDKAIAALSPGNDLVLLDDGQLETSPVQSAHDQDKALGSYFAGRNARIRGEERLDGAFLSAEGDRIEWRRGWEDQDEVEKRPKIAEAATPQIPEGFIPCK